MADPPKKYSNNELILLDKISELENVIKKLHSHNFILKQNKLTTKYNLDFEELLTKDDLINKKLSLSQLKIICKENKLNTLGNKIDLIDRIWGLNHPDEMPENAYLKKRGRKSTIIKPDQKENYFAERTADKTTKYREIYIGLYDYNTSDTKFDMSLNYFLDERNKLYYSINNQFKNVGYIFDNKLYQ